jgi:1-acyl-sn-glycerol-3-phosphate acyltransferase
MSSGGGPPLLIGLAAVLLAFVSSFLAVAWARRGPADDLVAATVRLVLDLYIALYHRLRRLPGPPGPPIPLEGPAIVVANHRSGVDPLVLSACTRRLIHFLMAREYYEQRGLRWLFRTAGAIPVNRDGNDLGATKAALKALKEGLVIGIFPEGGIRPQDGEEPEAGKSGVALLALKTGAPVVPAYISGTPAYDSVLRAMITPSRSQIRFGEAMRFAPPAGRKPSREEIDEAARRVRDRIGELRSSVEREPAPPARIETASGTPSGDREADR